MKHICCGKVMTVVEDSFEKHKFCSFVKVKCLMCGKVKTEIITTKRSEGRGK